MPLSKVRDRGFSELFTGASTAFAFKLLGMAAGYAFTLAVSRTLGPAAWGVFSLSLVVLTLASIVGRLGVDTAALRLVAVAHAEGGRKVVYITRVALAIVLPASVLVSVATYLSADLIARVAFDDAQLGAAIRFASIGIPPVALSLLCSQVLRAVGRVREYVFFDLVARFLLALVLLGPLHAWLGDDVGYRENLPILSFVVGAYVVAAANLWVMSRRIGAHQHRAAFRPAASEMLRIGVPLLFATSAMYLKGWIDTVMLGVYATPQDVGVYNIALKLAALSSLPLMAVNTIAAPRMAAAFGRGDTASLARVVNESGRLILFTSIPVAVILVAAPRVWLGIFGPEVTVAAPALVVLSLAYLASAMAGSVGYFLQMTGHQVAFQIITVVTLCVSVVLNTLLIPRYGILGAALTTAAGLLLWNAVGVVWAYRSTGIVTVARLAPIRAAS